MIDLSRPLPDSIIWDGVEYPIDTDFRAWIKFDRTYREHSIISRDVFLDNVPDDAGAAIELMGFYAPREATPRGNAGEDRAVDYTLDGSYLVASFMQAYGIDLTTAEMHWHVFLALVNGLPEDTILGRAMGYRTWRKSGKKPDEAYAELKRKWRLPEKGEDEERKNLLAWADEIGL